MLAAARSAIHGLHAEAIEFLGRLVSSNSFTGHPPGVRHNAELIAEQFAPLGFAAELVPAEDSTFGPHLFLARRGTSGPGLLLVTHLDTVYPAEEELRHHFHWHVEGARIYGPGVNDNKGGTAMIWLALAALQKADPELFARIDWLVAANAAEEELPRDFPERCRERLPQDCQAALVFEACGGMGRGLTLVQCRKGSANLRILAEGRGAHAGSRHAEGANAVIALSRAIERISSLTDYERELTVNIGRVSGGGPANRVPHAAECDINIRAFEPSLLDGAIEEIRRLLTEIPPIRAASDGYACRLSLEILSRNPAWPRNGETDRLAQIWRHAAERAKIPLLIEPRGGLSDGNYLSQFLPTLDGLGPFGLNGHSSERSADGSKVPEFVLPESFATMGLVNLLAISSLLRR